jgi:hypothetical protein
MVNTGKKKKDCDGKQCVHVERSKGVLQALQIVLVECRKRNNNNKNNRSDHHGVTITSNGNSKQDLSKKKGNNEQSLSSSSFPCNGCCICKQRQRPRRNPDEDTHHNNLQQHQQPPAAQYQSTICSALWKLMKFSVLIFITILACYGAWKAYEEFAGEKLNILRHTTTETPAKPTPVIEDAALLKKTMTMRKHHLK